MREMKIAMICAAAVLLMSGCGSSGSGSTAVSETVPAVTTTTSTTTTTVTTTTTEASTTKASKDKKAKEEDTPRTAAEVFDMLQKSGLCAEMDMSLLYGSAEFGDVCEKLYGIPVNELTDGGVMFSEAGTVADEISVLAGKDGLAELLEQRAASRSEEFLGYAPEEQDKASKAVVFEHKGLTVMIISDNADKIKKSILAM